MESETELGSLGRFQLNFGNAGGGFRWTQQVKPLCKYPVAPLAQLENRRWWNEGDIVLSTWNTFK